MLAEIDKKIKLHPCQFGFKRGYDTQSNVLCVEAARKQGACNPIITDYMEAYDTPKWNLLTQKLQRYGLPPMLLRIVVNLMFREMFSVLIVNGIQLKRIRLNKGLFQGSLLSPVLFNIFIDDLLQGIHQKFATAGNRFPAVMYADDLLLLWRTESEALSMWIFLQNWNSDNLMRLKLPKCSYVTLGERYSLLESQGLSLQLTHKHLGVFLTARGLDWRSQVDHCKKG